MEETNFRIEPIGDGIEIHLPRRNLEGIAKVGWLLIGFGLFGTIFMAFWIGTPISWGIDMIVNQGGPKWFGALFIGFGCLGLGGLYIAIKAIAFGVVVLRNRTRCSVRVERNRVVGKERFGWFNHKTRVKRDQISELFILPLSSASEPDIKGKPASPSKLAASMFVSNFESLHAISTSARSGTLLAIGYQRELLESVATAIARELNRGRAGNVSVVQKEGNFHSYGDQGQVTVRNLTSEDLRDADFELPEDSKLEVVNEDDSVVYRVPAPGLWKGSSGLFAFSILWNGFMVIWTTTLVFAAFNANGNGPDIMFILVSLLFWAVGIAMLVSAIYMGKQSAMIGVRDGILFIERITIFGTKWSEYSSDQIESIEMASSNMEVNDVPVMNLRIALTEGKPVGMFSQLSNDELQWLAQNLNRNLGIEKENAEHLISKYDPSQPIEIPVSTDIQIEQNGDATTIFVPPASPQGIFALQVLGIIFAAVPFPLLIVLSLILGLDPFLILFATVFTLMGLVLFFLHRFVTTRNFKIVASDDNLEVKVRGFLSQRDVSICRGELQSLDVADSGTKINGRILYCLSVKALEGKGISMMTGREEYELVYVAQLIHQRMKLAQDES